jgi:predicted nucleic acid-binding protein
MRPLSTVDGLLAATALVHGMTLVTRNVRHVTHTGVKLLNPFS